MQILGLASSPFPTYPGSAPLKCVWFHLICGPVVLITRNVPDWQSEYPGFKPQHSPEFGLPNKIFRAPGDQQPVIGALIVPGSIFSTHVVVYYIVRA